MTQSEFLEKVHGLIALAETKGGSITESMMTEPFVQENLSAEQLLSLRSFLQASGVTVVSDQEGQAGRKSAMRPVKMAAARQTSQLKDKEKLIYNSYLEELALVKVYAPEEEESLLKRKAAGDRTAREKLVEGNLRQVVELAGRYGGKGVPLTDLIQEGNMELLLVVDDHETGSLRDAIEARVAEAMERLLEEHAGHDAFKNRMADMANKLMDASEELAGDNGEQPTIEELAKKLHVRPDEVKAVMKMSMDAMTIDETGLGGE